MGTLINKTLDQHAASIKRAMREIEKGFQVIAKELTEAKKQFDNAEDFNKWAQVEFGFKKTHIYQLLSSHKVLDVLENSAIAEKPQTETQTRELAKIKEPEQVVEVWQRVTDTYKPEEITAKKIAEVRDEIIEPETVEIIEFPKEAKELTKKNGSTHKDTWEKFSEQKIKINTDGRMLTTEIHRIVSKNFSQWEYLEIMEVLYKSFKNLSKK